MNKKQIGLALSVIIIIVSTLAWQSKNNNPDKKVESLEKSVEERKESSGYNECVEKVDAELKEYDNCSVKRAYVISEKLKEMGYNDGLDCIQLYEDPICQDRERYNAEISIDNEAGTAYDDCTATASQITSLTKIDCEKLLLEQ